MRRITLVFITTAIAGCQGETSDLLGQPVDASVADGGAGMGDFDAQTPDRVIAPSDGATLDTGDQVDDAAVELDMGPPPPPADLSLGLGLTCGLSEDDRVRAAVRHVACDPNTRATIPGLVEAFDAGLMGNFSGGVDNWLSFDVRQGCDYWRCMANARSCGEVAAECAPAVSKIACEPIERGSALCEGSRISYCARNGSEIVADCADFGAQCSNGECVKDGCGFGVNVGGGDTGVSCSADGTRLQVCAGAFEMECDAWLAGSSCASFAIQGELPTYWCSPTGQSISGAYPREDFGCGHGSLLMNLETRGPVQFDCHSEGFTGCGARGCTSM